MDIQNQIVDLKHKKSIIKTNNEMLKPISFVEDFSLTTIEEREVIVWGSASVFIFYIIYYYFSYLEIKQKALKRKLNESSSYWFRICWFSCSALF